jgi:hypothetical protein
VNAGLGPNISHAIKVTTAMAMMSGTNQRATWSAMRWMGARLRCAIATIWTIWASSVLAPLFLRA